ncbi:TY-Chap domain-containing protein [Nocardia sp. CA-107356]|uniref:TY-Chap domain-containing protein n=1 Tax=Nocardia sp. CA-107356 TaxID=3239972 RepID=UPI003D91F5EF
MRVPGGNMSEPVTTDWDKFVRALAQCLSELPSRATLIIAAPGNRYVQFVQYDIKLSVELAGNSYLTQPISPTGERMLRDLGWREPVARRQIDNWTRTLLWPLSLDTLVGLARSVAIGLRDALGVGTPVELRAMGWTETSGDLDLTVLGPIARRGVN